MIILIFGTKLRQNIFNSTKITKMLKNIEILEMTLKSWKRLDYNTRHRTKKFPASLVTFTGKTLNGKLHFLCCESNENLELHLKVKSDFPIYLSLNLTPAYQQNLSARPNHKEIFVFSPLLGEAFFQSEPAGRKT